MSDTVPKITLRNHGIMSKLCINRTLSTLLVLLLLNAGLSYAQGNFTISGTVSDTDMEPLVGVNVYIDRTLQGAITGLEGEFSFSTSIEGPIVLVISCIGFDDVRVSGITSEMAGISIVMKQSSLGIDEAIVVASSFRLGQLGNTVEKIDSYDVVMTGSSNGDIIAALGSFPGTQKVGENGRLYVRGGDSEEVQTFINRMHVLVPYTTNAENSVQRSRFSPFLFKGINFSLGGYDAEYGQALSSILPMNTTDISANDKLGISFSPLSFNAGGTKSVGGSTSMSFNADYMNMGLYNKMFPDRYDWDSPYQKVSGQGQLKTETRNGSVLKLYAGYDKTFFRQNVAATRTLDVDEDNVYVNTTLSKSFRNKLNIFAGAAISYVDKDMNDALVAGDVFGNTRSEVHLKTVTDKTFGKAYKIAAGVESYFRRSVKSYSDPAAKDTRGYDFDHSILSIFQNNSFMPIETLFFNFTQRLEYFSYSKTTNYMPRFSINYLPFPGVQFSVIYGIFSQSPDDDILAYGRKALPQSMSRHTIVSLSYNRSDLYFRVEPYYKKYMKLPLLDAGSYVSKGYGFSKGIDLFFDGSPLHNLRTTIAYSWNDSRRLYLDYPELSIPQYCTEHNFSISGRYYIKRLNTYAGCSYTFASGRPYHDPNLEGYMNAKTTPYGSLDINASILIGPKVIVYASVTNLTGKKNVFNYNYADIQDVNGHYAGIPVVASRDRFVYLGAFITISNAHAYEISNF